MTLYTPAPEFNADTLKAVLSGNRVDQLPALRGCLEKVAAICSEAMRNAAQPPLEFALRALETTTTQELMAQHEGGSAICMIDASQWSSKLLLCADRSCVFGMVELLLGGDGGQEPYATERTYSTIELGLMRILFERFAAALESAFAPVAATAFDIASTSDRIDFEALGGRKGRVVLSRFDVQLNGRQGGVSLAIPLNVIDSLRPALARTDTSQQKKPDARWFNQMQSEITRTSITLSAILDERLVPLQEITALRVGEIMQIDATPQTRVRIECYGEPLFWCHLGKSGSRYTLRVDELVDRDQEFMNQILAG